MQAPSGVRVAFAGLLVPNMPAELELHVTIAMRYDINEATSRAMQHDLNTLIRPHLPIRVNFGNFCLLGEGNKIPAYEVDVPDPVVKELLQRYYQQYYRAAPGKRLYPRLTMHVTVDSPEKLEAYESFMVARMREEPYFMVADTIFRTNTKGLGLVLDSLPGGSQEQRWSCPECGTLNPLEQKECSAPHCSQWRPMPTRPGDWSCPSCRYSNFASRDVCASCRHSRPAILTEQNAYDIALVASAPPIGQFSRPTVFPPIDPAPRFIAKHADWYCHHCNFKVFGSKPACSKCGTRRPN